MSADPHPTEPLPCLFESGEITYPGRKRKKKAVAVAPPTPLTAEEEAEVLRKKEAKAAKKAYYKALAKANLDPNKPAKPANPVKVALTPEEQQRVTEEYWAESARLGALERQAWAEKARAAQEARMVQWGKEDEELLNKSIPDASMPTEGAKQKGSFDNSTVHKETELKDSTKSIESERGTSLSEKRNSPGGDHDDGKVDDKLMPPTEHLKNLNLGVKAELEEYLSPWDAPQLEWAAASNVIEPKPEVGVPAPDDRKFYIRSDDKLFDKFLDPTPPVEDVHDPDFELSSIYLRDNAINDANMRRLLVEQNPDNPRYDRFRDPNWGK